MEFSHKPVLFKETIASLNIKENGIYVDGTLGAGGHSLGILEKTPNIKLIGIDQDLQALERAKNRLNAYSEQITLIHGNFRNITDLLSEVGISQVNGILLDIGVSSPQLDDGERGFSYHSEAKLDMRMDLTQALSAYEIVNNYSQTELQEIIWDYGEERWAQRISEFIVREREVSAIVTTTDLVNVIKKAIPQGARSEGPHPARRTFQALRIAVNDELNALETVLEQAIDLLMPQGRLAVITFHSLEDRVVKKHFETALGKCTCPPNLPICACGVISQGRLVNRKPITASAEELTENPRARSAKLRAFEKF